LTVLPALLPGPCAGPLAHSGACAPEARFMDGDLVTSHLGYHSNFLCWPAPERSPQMPDGRLLARVQVHVASMMVWPCRGSWSCGLLPETILVIHRYLPDLVRVITIRNGTNICPVCPCRNHPVLEVKPAVDAGAAIFPDLACEPGSQSQIAADSAVLD